MVSLASPDLSLITLRYDQLSKSVDLAVRDLLAAGSDPVALACYLWVCRRHNLQLTNSAALVTWGASWVQRILIEEEWGWKRDDDISSALLAASVMQEASGLRGLSDAVRTAAAKLLAAELDRHAIPFNHPGPGAMTLLGSVDLALDDSRLPTSIGEVIESFEQTMSAGRAFGIAFAVLAYKKISEEESLSALIARITEVIEDPETEYEDKIYLTQALRQAGFDRGLDENILRHMDMVVTDSPVWAYLMSGQEDIPSAGDGRAVVTVSHLCRAALLDLLIDYRRYAKERADKRIDERYRGRRLVGLSAFGLYALGFAAIWVVVGRVLVAGAGTAWRYLFVHDYGSISWVTVMAYQFVALSALPLIPVTIITLVTCWQFLVHSAIESDRRILEVLWRRNKRVLAVWVALLWALAPNIYSGLIGPAIQHTIDGK